MTRIRCRALQFFVSLFMLLLTAACGDGTGASATAVGNPPISLKPLPATVPPSPTPSDKTFDADRAMEIVAAQLALGPRWPGSPGHVAVRDYIIGELRSSGWDIEKQRFEYQGFAGLNIVARANQDKSPLYVLGAHYDTRRVADQTAGAAEQGLPVPGAVDGASGVAVLLELANSLDKARVPGEIWLAFFDLEDNGSGAISGWSYSAGSPFVAASIEAAPAAVVVVDMIGDKDQQLYYERNSDAALSQEIWKIAADLGYADAFVPEERYAMMDDHLPFIQRGFKVALIIDFDYPYWHTVEDSLDKVSGESLRRVGHTLESWLEK